MELFETACLKRSAAGHYPILFGIVLLCVVCLPACGQKSDSSRPAEKQSVVHEILAGEKNDQSASAVPAEVADRLSIKSITLAPRQPTKLDVVTASTVVEVDGDPNGVTFEYVWKINGKNVPNAGTDSLSLEIAGKNDQISVVVTPVRGAVRGLPAESMFVIVHSAPPTLGLKTVTQKAGTVVELQLVSVDPDGDKVVFALEPPVLEGMIVDKNTGKILWTPSKLEPKNYSVTASASDPEGVKTVATFSFKVGSDQ